MINGCNILPHYFQFWQNNTLFKNIFKHCSVQAFMDKINAYLLGETISSNSPEAYSLNAKSSFGEKKEDKIY